MNIDQRHINISFHFCRRCASQHAQIYKRDFFLLYIHSLLFLFHNWRFPLDVYYLFHICNHHCNYNRHYFDFSLRMFYRIMWDLKKKKIKKKIDRSSSMNVVKISGNNQNLIRLLFLYFTVRRKKKDIYIHTWYNLYMS
jgi:hypothetical protein